MTERELRIRRSLLRRIWGLVLLLSTLFASGTLLGHPFKLLGVRPSSTILTSIWQSARQGGLREIEGQRQLREVPAASPEDLDAQNHSPQCSIYVMDASKELAGLGGGRPCDIDDRNLWPHFQMGRGVDGLNRTHHSESQHASMYWLAKAIKGSKYQATDIDSADLVFVDYHCYLIQRTARLHDNYMKGVARQLNAVMTEGLAQHPRFAARRGADFVVTLPHPALNTNRRCARFNHTFLLAVEKSSFCPEDREKARDGRSLIVPYVAVVNVPGGLPLRKPSRRRRQLQASGTGKGMEQQQQWHGRDGGERLLQGWAEPPEGPEAQPQGQLSAAAGPEQQQAAPSAAEQPQGEVDGGEVDAGQGAQERPLLLFYRGSCPADPEVLRKLSSGKILRMQLVHALRGTSTDIDVHCSCGTCKWRMDHKEMMRRLGRARFCPVIAGDTQSSRRITEVVLAGCIPLFLGPPFHTLPLAANIDYMSFSVFVNMTNTCGWVYKEGEVRGVNSPTVLREWTLDTDVPAAAMVHAATFDEVVSYLRSMPEEAIINRQQALARERDKFLFASAKGGAATPLTDIVLRRLCEYAARIPRPIQE